MIENFDDIEGVCMYIDDLLIYGRNKEEHDERLRRVLERCRKINLKLNEKKCKFGLEEIKYLGHRITKNGLYPDDSHITAITKMPIPNDKKDVERFLGLVKLHSRPVLQYYDVNKPIVISVDASKSGLGACLMQNNLPVCYASKALTKAEQRYAQIEKELFACVFACEKFYAYIYGKTNVIIETDHKPLISIIKKPITDAPARLQRMLLRLQRYTFKLVYKPGKHLYIADALSRAYEPAETVHSSQDRIQIKQIPQCLPRVKFVASLFHRTNGICCE
ncbi:jg79 [Pararge aegeria aegeria]|uniref:Jg79 protein n=1 Tax=Pararge aegeria aegeria TaxID=348720 RepID=A0A8S4QFS9_9NEOP|nr:jg79 [Pararge aegeria aegeria]